MTFNLFEKPAVYCRFFIFMGKIFAYIDGFNSYHCLKSAIDDKNTIKKLANNEILEAKYKDHKLVGKYAGFI